MKRASIPRSTAFAVLLVALSLGPSGCERVAYYSLSSGGLEGEGGQPGETTTTTKTMSTTGSETSTSTPVTRGAVLEAVGVCAAALYEDVAASAAALREAAGAAAQSSDPAKQEAARAAWNEAIDRWQQAEVIRVGPAGPATVPGGKDMRDLVYSWPLVSRCLVEQSLVSKGYAKPDFSAAALVNVRGLAASEYLLFYEGTDNGCSVTATINKTGSWAALSTDELAARKRAYAKVVADDLALQTKTIADAWAKSGGDFAGQLAGAGKSGSLFKTDQLAMNGITDGFFVVDKDVKDLKVAKPLGLLECESTICPDAVESRFARRSRDHVKNNLIGFRRLFGGCAAANEVGFDDLLRSLGANDLADRMVANIDAAIAAAEAVPSPDLAVALVTDKASVAALHAAIKKITDALKTEIATVLDVELPQTVEGDND